MSWLTFAYAIFTVFIGFFAGYYFVLCMVLRRQVIEVLKKLEIAYDLNSFIEGLEELNNESED